MSIRSFRKGLRGICAAAIVSVLPMLTGCGVNNNERMAGVLAAYRAGDYVQSGQMAIDIADKADKHDKLVLTLEAGAIERAASQLQVSQHEFDQADDLTDEFEMEPDVRISQQTAAVAVNDSVLDYTGYSYDRIMLSTYKALNDMELGDLDRMGVDLTHAYQRQVDAVAKFQKEIAANAQSQSSGQLDVSQAQNDPNFQSSFQQQYADLNVEDMSAYTNYVNPFTEYLHGMYLTYAGSDSGELEQGATTMRRVAGLVRDNTYVQQDAVLADQIASGHQPTPTTYVIAELGMAPSRRQIKIVFPLILRGGQRGGTYQLIEAAFPRLEKRPCDCEEITVQAGTATFPTALVCDMDKVVEQEFKNELPGVVIRALVSAAAKAIASYAADQAAANSGNGFVNIGTQLGTAIYTHESTQADVRTWNTLPKWFCVAKLPTPTDRNISLLLPNGLSMPVHVDDGIVNVVYVKIVNLSTPPVIRQAKLK